MARAMKDSGIEWVGKIPENWNEPPLKSRYSFGKGLSIIVNILNPECIVIGGGVSKAGSIILDLLETSFTKNVLIDLHDTSIKLATLGNDAGIYGAARNILKNSEA